MATANSKGISRPSKPRPDWPLFAHHNGQWCKKVRGRLHYFGPWADPDAALANWVDQKDDLLAGRVPRKKSGELTLRDLVNRFLTAKKLRADAGEITQRTFNDLHLECERLLSFFGKERFADDLRPEDFQAYRAHLAKGRGAKSLDGIVNKQRSIFRWGYRNRLLKTPAEFGDSFNRPSRDVIARERARKGDRLFTRDQIHTLLAAADAHTQAMILLGVGNGLGNTDIARLEFRHLDLAAGWLTYPRPKTGVNRRSKLWPETIAALEASLAQRVPNDEFPHLVFLSKRGRPLAQDGKADWVTLRFWRLLTRTKIYRPGLSFYSLRHSFRTEADDCLDQVAVNYAMGHLDPSMAAHYRHRIRDERLEAVAAHVRSWLYGTGGAK